MRYVGLSKTSQGKTTIPEALRNMHNIKDGSEIEWYDSGNKIIVKVKK